MDNEHGNDDQNGNVDVCDNMTMTITITITMTNDNTNDYGNHNYYHKSQ